jgi:hypothetical protein
MESGVSVHGATGSLPLNAVGVILSWLWLPVLIALAVWWRRRQ